MITDDAVRDALEHLAQHAPGPDRVLLRLAAHDRARRQRRALTLVGSAVAAGVAVGAPLVLLGQRHSPAPGGSPSPFADPSADPSPSIVNDRITMRYRPTWLPDGMVETSRGVGSPDPNDTSAQSRSWHNAASGQTVTLGVTGPNSVDVTGLRRVAVHGGSGWVEDMAGRPSLTVFWQAESGVFLQVFVDGIQPRSTTLAVQIANSVTADGVSVLEMPVAFGWLPGEYRIAARSVAAAAHGWLARTRADNGKPLPQLSGVDVSIGAEADQVVGPKPGMTAPPTSVTVRGVTGTFVIPDMLLVPLPGGLWLRVSGGHGQADLVRIADTLRIGPVPDLGWLGTR